MKIKTLHCLIGIAALLLCQAVSAYGQMSKFQALYLFQFAKNTNWPVEDDSKPFSITVVGDNSVASELKAVVGNKTIGSRKISVSSSATATGLPKSDIIYLGESKSAAISQLVSAQAGNKVLIVSGTSGHCSQGAGISFVANGGKLNFEIHEGNIAKHGLKVTPKLVSLGTAVF